MSRKLVIDPVTRIEGHGKVVINLDDDHRVADARLHVVEFRGYERFVQGHPYWEAPVLLQRICGICFVSHHLAGAKVLDDMVGVGTDPGLALTPTAVKMRRLGHYAQMLQSHATAYFYLVVPEMMFGMDAAPEQRNLLGLLEADPALVTRVVKLRKWGQELLRAVFGKRMHGVSAVPGGVQKPLTAADRDRFVHGDEGIISLDRGDGVRPRRAALFREFHAQHRDEVDSLRRGARPEHVPGRRRRQRRLLRRPTARGRPGPRASWSEFDYHDYLDHFSEAVEEWSYMKFPFLTGPGPRGGHGAGRLPGPDERHPQPADAAGRGGAGGVPRLHRAAAPTR